MKTTRQGEQGASSALSDVVYRYRHSADDDELRYSLRSVAENLQIGRIWIVGDRPDWIRNVCHVRRPNSFGDRYRNSLEHVRAISHMDDVADSFVLMDDDFFILQPLDQMPIFHRGRIDEAHPNPGNPKRMGSPWRRGIWQSSALLERWGFPFDEQRSYELHVPLPVRSRQAMAEILDRAVAETPPEGILQARTLYGNADRLGGIEMRIDPKVSRASATATFDDSQLFISTNNKAFYRGRLGKDLRARFPEPSIYELT